MKTQRILLAVVAGMLSVCQLSAQWTTLGTGVYHENLIPDYDESFGRGQKWNVTIEESTETPGVYRFVPYHEFSKVAEWLEASDDTYMVIHAENPDKVWMEDFKPYPDYELFWFTHMVPDGGWEAEPAGYGTLADGKITFPANCMAFVNIYDPDQRWFVTNTTGEFVVELPGGEVVKDYAVFLSNPYCGADNKVPVTVVCAEESASIKYALYKGAKEADDALAAEVAASGTPCTAGELIVECPENGMYTLVVVSSDAEGVVQSFKSTELYGVYDNDNEWKSLGMTTYHEAIIAEHYDYPETDLEVEIQENTATPGFYRIVNPYAAYEYNFMERTDDHNHYIYVHAENPKAVWIENSPVGADFGYGDGRVTSDIAKALEAGYTLDEALAAGLETGVLSNGVVTFPKWGIWYADRDYFDGYWYSSGLAFSLAIPAAETGDPVDLSAKGTANCYIVEPGTAGSFDATHKGNSLTESVGDIAGCRLVWQTSRSLVTNLAYNDGRISFSTSGEPGNALVAATDADGTILWSWHLWITDYDSDNDYTTPANASGRTWIFMDRNLGATTTVHGDTGSYGMLFQWGRKDPFPGAACRTIMNEDYTYQVDGEPELYDIDNNILPTIGSQAQYHGSLALSIANPMTFYANTKRDTGEIDEYGEKILVDDPITGDWTDVSDDDFWGGESHHKTIYDPSPVGYKVPVAYEAGETPYDWLKYASMTWDNTGHGAEQDGQWFPATGTRVYASGGLDFPEGNNPYSGLWFGTKGKTSANLEANPTLYGQYMFIINGKRTFKVNKDRRSQGLSLRCVRDEEYDQTTGVGDVAGDDVSWPAEVYNLQGFRVTTAASAADLRALPSGLYIVRGKKLIVR